ncbi:MAG: NFACT RNA binding domain-containing protein, partial [Nitrospiraceae bacterium]
ISAAFERQYYEREADLTIARLRQAKISDLKKRLKKATRRVAALQDDLDKAFRYRDYARYGDLLKANLHQMQKGQEQLTVIDYFDTALPELVIPLDPAKSPHGNMEDYFKKYRKYIASEREIRPRLEADEQRLTTLRAELAEVECGIWQPALSQAAVVMPFTRSQEKSVAAKNAVSRSGPFRRFLSADGLPIYVGRNARENEALTFGEARPDDLWLHAHGTPGSHVVVRLENGADPPPETIRDAATLALLYSDLKKNGKGEVIYTRRKYVRKVKAKSPGTVTVTQEKTTFVTLDRARLDRLKERSR